MHSAIVVVTMPEAPFDSAIHQSWQMFLAGAPQEDKPRGVEKLGENVWIVNFQRNPAAFAQLVHSAERLKLIYRILPLQDAPLWLPVDADPKPT